MTQVLTAAALFFVAGVTLAEPIIDVIKIAGKGEKDVAAYLGKPSSCGSSKYGKKCQYKKGETEIVFINGKADWITIWAMGHIPFSREALGVLGLNDARPQFSNKFTLRWHLIQGLWEVSLFPGHGSYSDYAYIKVKTK